MKNGRKTVLFFQEAWGRGGIETYVMNVIRNLEDERYSFEVWSAYDWYNGFDDELRTLGVPRFSVFPAEKPSLAHRFRVGTRRWRERLLKGDVDVVHVNGMNGMTLAYVDIAARCGVPVRVAHSHNTDFGQGSRMLKNISHLLGRSLWSKSATVRFACSDEAGSYLFGNESYTFMPNGIDTNRFRFDPNARTRVRQLLDVDDHVLVIGSVGRLSEQKNPLFSVRVLAELAASGIDVRLLLVGDGELQRDVMLTAKRLGVDNLFFCIHSVDDPESYYCALDAFVMPSRFEGLPYALIEAQCSGLPCIVSEVIQGEARATSLVKLKSLSDGPAAWAIDIVDMVSQKTDRWAYSSVVAEAGFSIDACVSTTGRAYSYDK